MGARGGSIREIVARVPINVPWLPEDNMLRIPESEIGYAICRRPFSSLGRNFKNGDEIERSFLVKMPRGNLDAMSDSRQIEIFRAPPSRVSGKSATSIDGQAVALHLRAAGIGVYDVIKGVVVGAGLSKEAAMAMIDPDQQPGETDAQATSPAAPGRKPKKAGKRAKKPKKAKKARATKPRAAAAAPKAAPAAAPSTEEANGPIE